MKSLAPEPIAISIPTKAKYSSIAVPSRVKRALGLVKAQMSQNRKVPWGECLETILQHYMFQREEASELKRVREELSRVQAALTEMALNYSKAAATTTSPVVVQQVTTLSPVIPPPPPNKRKPVGTEDPLRIALVQELKVFFASGAKLVSARESMQNEVVRAARVIRGKKGTKKLNHKKRQMRVIT